MKKISNVDSVIWLSVLILLFACAFLNLISREYNNEANKYRVKIGQKHILDKDTLTIVDYSFIMETFTLSNGVEVDASIVFKNNKN